MAYSLLVAIWDSEASALAQSRFVVLLPSVSRAVTATLSHVLHGAELDTWRQLLSAHRVKTVRGAQEFLESNDAARVIDVGDSDPAAPRDADASRGVLEASWVR